MPSSDDYKPKINCPHELCREALPAVLTNEEAQLEVTLFKDGTEVTGGCCRVLCHDSMLASPLLLYNMNRYNLHLRVQVCDLALSTAGISNKGIKMADVPSRYVVVQMDATTNRHFAGCRVEKLRAKPPNLLQVMMLSVESQSIMLQRLQ